jgi:dihydrofolate reductase
MRKLVLFMHVSLDGFVAGPNGEMDWILVNEELFDFAERRTQAADTALYGRVTYEMMDAYWPTAADEPNPSQHDITHSRWYNQVPKVVLSRTMPDTGRENVTIVRDNLVEQIGTLKERAGGEIIIFGSPGAAHALMAEGLIDEYWLFVNPILLGQGIPVFDGTQAASKLALVSTKAFDSGVVCLHYASKHEG